MREYSAYFAVVSRLDKLFNKPADVSVRTSISMDTNTYAGQQLDAASTEPSAHYYLTAQLRRCLRVIVSSMCTTLARPCALVQYTIIPAPINTEVFGMICRAASKLTPTPCAPPRDTSATNGIALVPASLQRRYFSVTCVTSRSRRQPQSS